MVWAILNSFLLSNFTFEVKCKMAAGRHFDLFKKVAFFVGFILEQFGFGFFTDDVNKNFKQKKNLTSLYKNPKWRPAVILEKRRFFITKHLLSHILM